LIADKKNPEQKLQYFSKTYSTSPAEVDNDWSGRTSGFYGRYFQKEAQKYYRVSMVDTL